MADAPPLIYLDNAATSFPKPPEVGRPSAAKVQTLTVDAARTGVDLAVAVAALALAGIVLFGFPPNAGAVGTAAYLSVFESLFNTMQAMKDEGYTIDVPDSVDDLREAVLKTAGRAALEASGGVNLDTVGGIASGARPSRLVTTPS